MLTQKTRWVEVIPHVMAGKQKVQARCDNILSTERKMINRTCRGWFSNKNTHFQQNRMLPTETSVEDLKPVAIKKSWARKAKHEQGELHFLE